MTTLNRHVNGTLDTLGTLVKKPPGRLLAYCYYIAGVLVATAASAVLIASESIR